jgi:hypothetical protein
MSKEGFKTLVAIGLAVVFMVGVAALMKSYAATRTVSWGAVTTYTDNTLIEAGNTVTYSIWREDSSTLAVAQLANRVTGLSTTFDDSALVKGRLYNFWGQAFLTNGAFSDNSPKYAWTLPLGKASTMGPITIN